MGLGPRALQVRAARWHAGYACGPLSAKGRNKQPTSRRVIIRTAVERGTKFEGGVPAPFGYHEYGRTARRTACRTRALTGRGTERPRQARGKPWPWPRGGNTRPLCPMSWTVDVVDIAPGAMSGRGDVRAAPSSCCSWQSSRGGSSGGVALPRRSSALRGASLVQWRQSSRRTFIENGRPALPRLDATRCEAQSPPARPFYQFYGAVAEAIAAAGMVSLHARMEGPDGRRDG